MAAALTFWTAASSAATLAISPEAPEIPPEVAKSIAAGRTAKLFVYPAGPTETASRRAHRHVKAETPARRVRKCTFIILVFYSRPSVKRGTYDEVDVASLAQLAFTVKFC